MMPAGQNDLNASNQRHDRRDTNRENWFSDANRPRMRSAHELLVGSSAMRLGRNSLTHSPARTARSDPSKSFRTTRTRVGLMRLYTST